MPTVSRPGPNRRALTKALKALTGLTDEHAALVEHAKQLANLVDEYPTEIKAHAEYRAALKTLVEIGKPKSADALSALLIEIRGQ
jgi:hypothetical protein